MRNLRATLKSTDTTLIAAIALAGMFILIGLGKIEWSSAEAFILAALGALGVMAKDGRRSSQDVGLRP